MPAPTATTVPCFDLNAKPRQLPARQTPLEVHYISDGNLWVWTEGAAQAIQISMTGDAQSFTFSPDGEVIVFTRGDPDGQISLWSIRRDGSSLPQLLWAPDSLSLVAVTFTEDFSSDQATFTTWRLLADGSPAALLATFTGSPYSVQVSQDRQYLLYTRLDAAGSNQRTFHLATIDDSKDLAYAQGEGMEGLGWAPDGFHFLFDQDTVLAPQIGSLCGNAQSLLSPAMAPVRDIEWVDATHFLFVSGAYGDPNAELHLGEVSGSSIMIGKIGFCSYYLFVPDNAALGK